MNSTNEGRKAFLTGVTTIAAAFIIGTFAMIYNNDKNSQLFVKELSFLARQVADLKEQIKVMQVQINANTLDRWTRTEHDGYNKEVQARFFEIEKRLYKLETRLKP